MIARTSSRATEAPAGRGARRRRSLLEAAVEVVAASGLRGLTHRAVDARADFPEGTTSAYFRTRLALLSALTEHVTAQVSADVETLAQNLAAHVGDHEYAIAQTQILIETWLGEWKMLTTRLELGIEAARQPELAETFRPWRDHLLDVIQQRLCEVGVSDTRLRAEIVVASLDGILMATLAAPPARRRALVVDGTALLLHSLLGDAGESDS